MYGRVRDEIDIPEKTVVNQREANAMRRIHHQYQPTKGKLIFHCVLSKSFFCRILNNKIVYFRVYPVLTHLTNDLTPVIGVSYCIIHYYIDQQTQ